MPLCSRERNKNFGLRTNDGFQVLVRPWAQRLVSLPPKSPEIPKLLVHGVRRNEMGVANQSPLEHLKGRSLLPTFSPALYVVNLLHRYAAF